MMKNKISNIEKIMGKRRRLKKPQKQNRVWRVNKLNMKINTTMETEKK